MDKQTKNRNNNKYMKINNNKKKTKKYLNTKMIKNLNILC